MHRALSSSSSSCASYSAATTSAAAKHKHTKRRPLGFYEKALSPPNPRFAHVASRIDSGPTVAKVRTITTRQFVRRRNEAFARVAPRQLGALAAEYGEEGGSCGAIMEEEEGTEGDDVPCCGGGRSVIVTHDPTREAPLYEKPYLLLDVRAEGEAFERARLVDARHLPPLLLRQDRLPPELLRFRNREGTLLILYDQNDGAPAEAAAMATELVLRGWENVYVLSGGLDAVALEHPQLVEGSSPPPTVAAAATKGQADPLRLCEANLSRLALLGKKGREAASRGGRSSSGSHSGRGGSYSYKGGARTASVASAAGSMVVKKRCGGGTAPSVTTAGTGLSVAETVIARAQARKGMF